MRTDQLILAERNVGVPWKISLDGRVYDLLNVDAARAIHSKRKELTGKLTIVKEVSKSSESDSFGPELLLFNMCIYKRAAIGKDHDDRWIKEVVRKQSNSDEEVSSHTRVDGEDYNDHSTVSYDDTTGRTQEPHDPHSDVMDIDLPERTHSMSRAGEYGGHRNHTPLNPSPRGLWNIPLSIGLTNIRQFPAEQAPTLPTTASHGVGNTPMGTARPPRSSKKNQIWTSKQHDTLFALIRARVASKNHELRRNRRQDDDYKWLAQELDTRFADTTCNIGDKLAPSAQFDTLKAAQKVVEYSPRSSNAVRRHIHDTHIGKYHKLLGEVLPHKYDASGNPRVKE